MLALNSVAMLYMGHAEALSAKQVLLKMESMYAHLQSYSDTGTYSTDSENVLTREKYHADLKFQTKFKSAGKLFFQFNLTRIPQPSKSPRAEVGILCASGKKGFRSPDPEFPPTAADKKPAWVAEAVLHGKKQRDVLSLELARFTGVSYGTACNVPTMLFPECAGRRFDELENPEIVGSETIEGEPCYVIEGNDKYEKLWIGKHNFALYRVSETVAGPSPYITIYHPILNPKIADSEFILRPPK